MAQHGTRGTHATTSCLPAATRLSRRALLAAVAVALLLGAATGTAPWAASGPLVLAVAAAGLLLGLPHGALDHVLATRLTGWSMPVVLTAYAASAALAWVALVVVGLPALLAVLALSLAHFVAGEAEVARAAWGWPAGRVTVLVLGVAGTGALLLPLARADRTLLDVAGALSPALGELLAHPATRAGLVASWLVAALLTVRAARRDGVRGPARDLGVLGVVALVLPPLVAFGLWFGLWHGARHLARLLEEEPGAAAHVAAGRPRAAVAHLARLAAWPSLAALVALVAVVLATTTSGRGDAALAQAVQVLLALTVPHMLVVAVMDRRARDRDGEGRSGSLDRDHQGEGAAAAELGVHPDVPAVQPGDPAGDRQAQAGARDAQGVEVAGAVEGVEEVGLVGGGDADPGVGDRDRGPAALAAHGHLDPAAGPGVLHGVAADVVDHPAQLLAVPVDHDRAVGA